ncbi:MAG: hypothetical protein HN742_30530 [Lentisphaerae bacterium]|nr:hypothetical protein [Lentisphaerota bacterium]MBT4822406.1 hypothetical protein [Lentisphaerota bacterium]MBT5612068.1 hypothetical protein [Lentisphaerota bacterium]MBT7061889.1 hypothetical protein [Lentisphaerota bacterium]MBT7846248.1 hypothetical protein [Lentisphaerota bacterium]
MYTNCFASLLVLVTVGCLEETMAQGAESWVVADEIGGLSEPWSVVLRPETGPPRDGGDTCALRWPVATRPGPNSPVLLPHFEDVAAVRFRLWTDGPKAYKLNVLLTGRGGYFNSTMPLDWTGWKLLTVPIKRFGSVRGAKLADMQRLSFRMQGYGQPELPREMIWWVDDVALLPKSGRTLALTSSIEVNRGIWEKLAGTGNPLAQLLVRAYDTKVAPFKPPEKVTSAWQYRTVAEELTSLAWVACDPGSPQVGREDLVQRLLGGIDWLVAECNEEGWWWRKNPPTGDPNVNRFVLGPLLDTVRFARMRPEGKAAWPRWRAPLDRAIELQRAAYRFELAWDWGGKAGGEYANQDAYLVIIAALSAQLYDRPADQELAADMARKISSNLLPDGGIRYIGITNEAPVYHSLNLTVLGRYATLTKDPVVVKLLHDTAPYWPLVLSAEGQPEYWSDVWWKQTWGYVSRNGLIVAAGATGDARNQWLLWRVLERTAATARGWSTVCAMPYWTGAASGTPLPDPFVTTDRNMRGVRGRAGNWYYGVCIGRGLRNTFCGGMITHPTHSRPVWAAIRGLQINVLQRRDKRMQGLWLSQIEDHAGLAMRPNVSGAVGVRYRLQPRRINGVPTPETPDSPWQVTQVWRAGGDGLLGMIVLEALEDAPGIAVQGRVALGQIDPKQVGGKDWQAGPLRVRFYDSFGTASVQPVPANTTPTGWPGIVCEQPLTDGAKAGQRFVYSVWLGPETTTPPDQFERLPKDMGWLAVWEDGRRVATVFNPGSEQTEIRVPWSEAPPRVWSGLAGREIRPQLREGTTSVQLPAGRCALLER